MADYEAPAEVISLRDLGAAATVLIGRTTLAGLTIVNSQAAVIFVQLFDSLLAGVTLGTTVPYFEFSLPASSSASVILPVGGLVFRKGIVAASTTLEKGSVASAAGVEPFFLVLD